MTRRDLIASIAGAGLLPGLAFVQPPGSPKRKPLRFVLDMVCHNPGEPRFVTKFNDPAVLKKWGYNGQVIKSFPQTALMYEAFDDQLVPKGSVERVWAETHGRFIDQQIAAAKAAKMPIYNFTDVLVIPENMLVKYADELTEGTGTITKETIEKNRKAAVLGSLHGTGRRISIKRPMTQKIIRAQLNELFDRFPDLTGIFIRFGETYLQDSPFHVGGSPVSGAEEHKILLQLLREEVCVNRNKVVFYRTWGWDGFLVNPDFYRSITDTIEPHPNLIFSIKHTSGDFTRDVPFNRTLGVGKHAQLVEVSCNQAGLYGKNAYPYYIGKGVIEGWSQWGAGVGDKGLDSLVDNPLLAGVWTWTRGDGWSGPFTPNEFWVDLNAYLVSQYGQNPGRDEKEIFDEYCRKRLRLSRKDSEKFRELCLTATAATFHGQESSVVPASSWWCRDQAFSIVNLGIVVDRKLKAEVLAEKAKAVADWKRVEQLAREIRLPNTNDQKFVEVSSTYGRIKIAITEQIWIMQILDAEFRKFGKRDIEALAKSIKTYDELWVEWRKLKAENECCPTLYTDEVSVWADPPFQSVLKQYRLLVQSSTELSKSF